MPLPSRPNSAAAPRSSDPAVLGALTDPVLVVGMHRSGTSVVAGMLTDLGVFLDPAMPPPPDGQAVAMPTVEQRRNGYAESTDFRLLNEQLLLAADAAWDHPEPFLVRRGAADFDARCVRMLRRGAGVMHGFLEPMAACPCVAWGWKDPRTSLTLPHWLQLFPGARVIHVVRNPASVSRSLLVRAAAWAEQPAASPQLRERIRHAASHPANTALRVLARMHLAPRTLARTAPPMDDARARVLWDLYVQECRQWGPKAATYLELEFETVLDDPAAASRQLAEFVGLSPSPERLANAAAFVERGGRTAAAPSQAAGPAPTLDPPTHLRAQSQPQPGP